MTKTERTKRAIVRKRAALVAASRAWDATYDLLRAAERNFGAHCRTRDRLNAECRARGAPGNYSTTPADNDTVSLIRYYDREHKRARRAVQKAKNAVARAEQRYEDALATA